MTMVDNSSNDVDHFAYDPFGILPAEIWGAV